MLFLEGDTVGIFVGQMSLSSEILILANFSHISTVEAAPAMVS